MSVIEKSSSKDNEFVVVGALPAADVDPVVGDPDNADIVWIGFVSLPFGWCWVCCLRGMMEVKIQELCLFLLEG